MVPRRVAFRLELIVTDEGEVRVHGPVADKVICLGVLEMAKAAVLAFKPSPILHPDGSMLPAKPPNGE